MSDQLTLFDVAPAPEPDPAAAKLRQVHEDARALAARLPPGLFFGTSSWSFPDFLSVDRLVGDLLGPCAAAFAEHTGPILLEFPPFPREDRLDPADFHDRLDRFLGRLPSDFEYAVELRDARLLTARHRDLLGRHGVAHTYNYWSAMPGPADQAAVVPPEDGHFAVVRLLLRPGTWYEGQRERFHPFDRMAAPDEAMRAAVVTVVRRGLTGGSTACTCPV